MDVAQPQQVHFVLFERLAGQRVAEEEQQIDLVAGNQRGDLLVPALGAAEKAFDGQAGRFRNQAAGGAGRAEVMPVCFKMWLTNLPNW